MYKNKIVKNQLPPHQLVKSEINIPYKNIGELFNIKFQVTPDKIFLICPGKKKDVFSFKNYSITNIIII